MSLILIKPIPHSKMWDNFYAFCTTINKKFHTLIYECGKMVEPRRIELLSENRSANLSTRLVKSFEIPFLLSGSQDRSPVVL